DALVADTLARVEALAARRVGRRVLPRDARWVPLAVLIALAISLEPPVQMPTGGLPDSLPSRGEDEGEERSASTLLEERTRALAKQPLRRAMLEERDLGQRAGAGGATSPADLTAIFKDTSLSGQRPDFNSFLKKGDERLKLLEHVDRLPDLQSD